MLALHFPPNKYTLIVFRLEYVKFIINIICAKTTHIGCAIVLYGDKKFTNALIFCNYGPETCIEGSAIYKPGNLGTGCDYTVTNCGLCWSKTARASEFWIAPFGKIF